MVIPQLLGSIKAEVTKQMRSIKQIAAVYEKIINSNMSNRVKKLKLQALSAEIRRTYKISERDYTHVEIVNPEILSLYQIILMSIDQYSVL